jgi:hypothetical protein
LFLVSIWGAKIQNLCTVFFSFLDLPEVFQEYGIVYNKKEKSTGAGFPFIRVKKGT